MIADLRALSLSQPWAWCMTMPAWGLRKDVENRRKPCPKNMIGKRFCIHAAQSWDQDGAVRIHQAGLRFPPKATIATGAIVALATIDRQVTSASELPVEQRRWFFGPYGYVFRDLAVLAKPVPVKGMLGFWRVPADVAEQVLGLLVADAREHAAIAGYSETYTETLLAAVRRTGRRGKDLDDCAWEYATPRSHGLTNIGRTSYALQFLGGVDAA